MSDFDHDYIEFDDLGIKNIFCMSCAAVVATRMSRDIKINSDPPETKTVLSFQKLDNWRQIRLALSDGSFCEPIVCVACDGFEIDRAKSEKIAWKVLDQIKRAAIAEKKFAGAPQAEIDEYIKANDALVALRTIPRETRSASKILSVSLANEHEKTVQSDIASAQIDATPK